MICGRVHSSSLAPLGVLTALIFMAGLKVGINQVPFGVLESEPHYTINLCITFTAVSFAGVTALIQFQRVNKILKQEKKRNCVNEMLNILSLSYGFIATMGALMLITINQLYLTIGMKLVISGVIKISVILHLMIQAYLKWKMPSHLMLRRVFIFQSCNGFIISILCIASDGIWATFENSYKSIFMPEMDVIPWLEWMLMLFAGLYYAVLSVEIGRLSGTIQATSSSPRPTPTPQSMERINSKLPTTTLPVSALAFQPSRQAQHPHFRNSLVVHNGPGFRGPAPVLSSTFKPLSSSRKDSPAASYATPLLQSVGSTPAIPVAPSGLQIYHHYEEVIHRNKKSANNEFSPGNFESSC